MNIADKNDMMRKTFLGCRVVMTAAVADLPYLEKIEVFKRVKGFNEFSEDSDPHKEHDFGSFAINKQRFFWKFDYYDSAYTYYEEDGHRLLTIGFMSDY